MEARSLNNRLMRLTGGWSLALPNPKSKIRNPQSAIRN
jgi:hypothetical protein